MNTDPYVYLIECNDNYETIYKIGYTKNNPTNRIKQLQTGNSSVLKLVTYYQSEYSLALESMLHNHFSSKKIKNEWFRLDLLDVVNFKIKCTEIESTIKILIESQNNHFKKWIKTKN